jgi:hypothetical protein
MAKQEKQRKPNQEFRHKLDRKLAEKRAQLDAALKSYNEAHTHTPCIRPGEFPGELTLAHKVRDRKGNWKLV